METYKELQGNVAIMRATNDAAVAAAKAIEEVCGISVGIKWVNDLILHGRKVGGILTESTLTGEGRLSDGLFPCR